MAPDLDNFIRSDHDPLIYLEYHRHFTHSLIFIPVGGLICAAFFHFVLTKRKELAFKWTWLFCTLGYATHGLLDAATSYGTQLFWPFSDVRIAWRIISIIDPLFTLPALLGVILCAIKRKALFAHFALGWVVFYLSLGIVQNQRATQAGFDLAKSRGHNPEEIHAKPSFANLIVWKTVYRDQDRYYVDAHHISTENHIFEGSSIAALDIARDFPWLDLQSQQAKDIERFRWFSDGYIARDPVHEDRIIDLRYSYLPNDINALWSIKLSPDVTADTHVRFIDDAKPTKEQREMLLDMIFAPVKAATFYREQF